MLFVAVAILLLGILLMYSGWKNQSPTTLLGSVFGA